MRMPPCKTRAEMDALCWQIMRNRERPTGVPTLWHNYGYLGREMLRGTDFEDAIHHFGCRREQPS